MNDNHVIVCRTYDPVQADMLGELLRENGIAARVLGTRHGALIGVGQNILQMHIEVPRSQAGEATDFIEAFFQEDGAKLLREAIGYDDGADEVDDDDADQAAGAGRQSTLRPLFAAGLALMASVIGGAHLYGRRPFTALAITAGNGLALANIIRPEWTAVATGLAMYATLLALDMAGGQVAVRAHNRGARSSTMRQLVTGALFVVLASAVGAVVGPRVPAPERQEAAVEMPRPALHGALSS